MADACYCDYEPAEFYRVSKPSARKVHRCDECRREIQLGETYESVFAKWGGIAQAYRTCCDCLEMREWVLAHVPCFCWAHSIMRENAEETIREYMHECPGLWFGWARREVAIRKAAHD